MKSHPTPRGLRLASLACLLSLASACGASRPAPPPDTPAPALPEEAIEFVRANPDLVRIVVSEEPVAKSASTVVKKVKPQYPKAALAMGASGRVLLRATIGTDGRVEAVSVDQAPHEVLAEAAREAVLQWRYTPPLSADGVPVRITKRIKVDFVIEDDR